MKISPRWLCRQTVVIGVLWLGVRPGYAWLRGGEGKTGASGGHWNITNEILKEAPFDDLFSPNAKNFLCRRSSHLDFTFLGLIDLAGWWLKIFRLPSEKPNHWEGTVEENRKRLDCYLGKAIQLVNDGETEEGLAELANALHVGQDRGSHEHDHRLFEGNPDNRLDNPLGWEKAKAETREIFRKFSAGLTEELRVRLKVEKD
jgi:hypothetical protein